MGIGKGGSSQDQSGNSSQNYSADQKGATTVNPTANWDDISALLKANLGPTGLNPGQQAAADDWTNYLSKDSNNGLWQQIRGNAKLDPFTNATAHTIDAAPSVTARTGASFMEPYQTNYTNNVVDSTLADLGHANDVQGNRQKMAAAAGGAFGGGRQGVAEGTLADNYLRTLASTDSGLRDTAFNTAAGYGMSDANRFLTADTTNASNTMQGNMFNAGQKNVADQTSMNAIQSMINNAGNTMKLGGDALKQQFDMAGGGLGNLGSFLATQVPAFGSSTTGNTSGSSQGINSSNSTGKNGGISLG